MRSACVACAVLLTLAPMPASAWGLQAHRFIMDQAIGLLPAELRPIFDANRAMVVERAIDPDTWRIAGFGEESPNHFLDIDADGYGPYPFAALPRNFDEAVAKFGRARVVRNGTLPWRVEEVYGNLRRSFESYARGNAFGAFDIPFLSAVLSHYVADAHVPLHGVTNYNGQVTGQTGVHERWETALFERFRDRLAVAPRRIEPIRTPRDFVFDRLLEDTRLTPALLKSDLDAIGERDAYDDAYYVAFYNANKTVIEDRLNQSIAAVAAMIAGAWEAAGRPPVPARPSNAPERRRRP